MIYSFKNRSELNRKGLKNNKDFIGVEYNGRVVQPLVCPICGSYLMVVSLGESSYSQCPVCGDIEEIFILEEAVLNYECSNVPK